MIHDPKNFARDLQTLRSELRDLGKKLASLSAELKGLRDLVDDRRQADKEAVSAALVAAEKAVNAALQSSDAAARKFDESLREYKAVSNEWRATVEGLIVQLREVSELRGQIKVLTEKVADLRESRSSEEASDLVAKNIVQSSRVTQRWIIGLVVIIILFVISEVVFK